MARHLEFDVLVIGSGAACLTLPPNLPATLLIPVLSHR